MRKIKYLHNTRTQSKKEIKFKRSYIDFNSDDLPKREKMCISKEYREFNSRILYNFLCSKIGQDWDIIYSEILTKTKKKYRYQIDRYINLYISYPIYNEEYVPRSVGGYLLMYNFFIDINNKLRHIDNKEELLNFSKKVTREQKLIKLINIIND